MLERTAYETIRKVIRERYKDHSPFSMIRIGDGESVIFEWPRNRDSEELKRHMRMWFGVESLSDTEMKWLRRRLIEACRGALILGIPTEKQRELHKRYEISYSWMTRLNGQKRVFRNESYIVDAAIHRLLHLSGDLVSITRGSRFIGLVGCRRAAGQVHKVIKPEIIYEYVIPSEISDGCLSGRTENQWLPDRYDLLRKCISVPFRGACFLVAGGVMGKLICQDIVKKGGSALDIGSVMDGWAGRVSREYFGRYDEDTYTLEASERCSEMDDRGRLDRLIEVLKERERYPESFYIEEGM